MNSLKGNVIEGIGDLLTKLPLDSILESKKIGEVDIQTRYYEPMLSGILTDITKRFILRWPDKTDETAPKIRPDAIISTLIQLKFGRHLGNTCLENEDPILIFQVNGFQLILYVIQRINHRFYTIIWLTAQAPNTEIFPFNIIDVISFK
ncbi:hypothetical protein F4703DRAFT_1846283 [Phycomyces blakesleeanus]